MSTLTVTPTYSDTSVLTEAQLDVVKDTLETYFNTTKIDDDNLQTNEISASKLGNSAVTTAKIASSAITTIKLQDDTITTSKINNSACTTAKFETSSSSTTGMVTSNFGDAEVTTAKLASNSVPKSIMLLPYYSTTSITDGTVAADSSVVSVTATGLTVGKPLLIMLESSSTSSGSGYTQAYSLRLFKDGTAVCDWSSGSYFSTFYATKLPPSTYAFFDTPTSTSHTYLLKSGTATNAIFNSTQLKIMQVL